VSYDRGVGAGAFDGVDVIPGQVLMELSGALRFKVNGGLAGNCNTLWWFDNNATVCAQKQFCGSYAYYGLRTFQTESLCLAALNGSCALAGDRSPCGQITLNEVVDIIKAWGEGSAQLNDVIDLIVAFNK
jgi:hypothetical protein